MSSLTPLAFVNRWLIEPIVPAGSSVEAILDAINVHALSADDSSNYFMRARRYREAEGRFRIWGECQDVYYCFVKLGTEGDAEPPVFFESSLDLVRDYGLDASEVDDGCVLVASTFSAFLWFAFGQQICIRLSASTIYRQGVQGFTFRRRRPIYPGDEFWNPLRRDFPAGYTPWISDEAICIPDWGAAFRDERARAKFERVYRPEIATRWSVT